MDCMFPGRALVVDLGSGQIMERELTDDLVAARLGGGALGLALYEEYRDEDPIVVCPGLLTASLAPASSMAVVTCRSPINGRVMHSPIVNSFGSELKLAGFGGLVIFGRSGSPSYLWLRDGMADLLPAEALWGKDTWSTADMIREEQGDGRVQVLSVGPAGEKGGSIGQAVVDYWSEGDKIGLGARMGRAGLKAVACRGLGEMRLADPPRAFELCLRGLRDSRAILGASRGVGPLMPHAYLKGFERLVHRHSACSGCPWPCRSFLKFNEPPGAMGKGVGEPGVLVIDAPGYVSLLRRGFDAEMAARLLERASRLGIEPVAASRIVPAEYEDALLLLEDIAAKGRDVEALPQVEGCSSPDSFSAFAPNGGEPLEIALAYILGICPRYAAKAGMDLEYYSELVEASAGLRTGPEELEVLASSLIR